MPARKILAATQSRTVVKSLRCRAQVRRSAVEALENRVLLTGVTLSPHSLVVNGGFEQPVGIGQYATIPGWTLKAGTGGGDIEIATAQYVGTPYEANQFTELNSNAPATIYQTAPTVAGKAYTFSFAFSARAGTSPADNDMQVSANGAVLATVTADGSSLSDTSWKVYKYTVTAKTAATTLQFASLSPSGDSVGGELDAVQFIPVGPTLSDVANFNKTDGSGPDSTVTFDSSGNLFGTTRNGGDANGDGTVFEIAKGSKTITTVAKFNNADGSRPIAGVTFDSSGNLFGTTAFGGDANGDGTVFEIAKGSKTITTVAKFNGADGATPDAAVTFDSSGNLFGTTSRGGDADYHGTVFEIAKGSKTITTLAKFNGADGAIPDAGVTFDSSGNLFGTAAFGGDANGDGAVFEIAKGSKTITTVAKFNGADGATSEAAVTFDSSGNLFGTTGNGGNNEAGTVFEIAKGSKTITTIAKFNGADGAHPVAGVTFDLGGNLFGTASSGGDVNNDGTVFEIAKGSKVITAIATFNGTDGSMPYASVTFDSSGNLFGTTYYGGNAVADGNIFELTGVEPAIAIKLTAPASQTASLNVAKSFALGSFSETNATGPYTVAVNWGDGSAVTKFTQASPGTIKAASHTFKKPVVETVTVTVTDAKGHVSNVGSFKVTV